MKAKIPQSNEARYEGLTTKDKSIRSFVSSFDNFVVVTNSIDQLTQIAKVFEQKAQKPSLPRGIPFLSPTLSHLTNIQRRCSLLLITDATIREMVWTRMENRGVTANQGSQLPWQSYKPGPKERGSIKLPGIPTTRKSILCEWSGTKLCIGNLAFLKSVNELSIKNITPAEKKAYEFFRDRYQSHWSKYFDPICGQLIINEGTIKLDLSILPLIGGTDYRQ